LDSVPVSVDLVLHRPVETTAQTGKVKSWYGTCPHDKLGTASELSVIQEQSGDHVPQADFTGLTPRRRSRMASG